MEQAPLILLVDDDPNVCRLLKLYLGRAGYRVLSAPDGVSALEIYAAERPDLAILDIMLPGLDGREICRRIREQDDLPIIFLTARDATGTGLPGSIWAPMITLSNRLIERGWPGSGQAAPAK